MVSRSRLFQCSASFALAFSLSGLVLPAAGAVDQKLVVKPVVEKKVNELPRGELYWRIEHFPSLAQAQAAAGGTGLAAEIDGKVWLFTLAAKGGSSGGSKVAEIGPIPPIAASEYLLRINYARGAPGTKTSVHSHPGSETFYVLAGRLGQRTPHGVAHVDAGHSMVGHGANVPMQVFSDGTSDLEQVIMFVVDATKPFSTPAKLP